MDYLSFRGRASFQWRAHCLASSVARISLGIFLFVFSSSTLEAADFCGKIFHKVRAQVSLKEKYLTPYERITRDVTGERSSPGRNRWRDAHTVLTAIALVEDYKQIQRTSDRAIREANLNISRLERAREELSKQLSDGTVEQASVEAKIQQLPMIKSRSSTSMHSEVYSRGGMLSSTRDFKTLDEIDREIESMQMKREVFASILHASSVHQAVRLRFLSDLRQRFKRVEEGPEVATQLANIPVTDLTDNPQVLRSKMENNFDVAQAYIENRLRSLMDSEGQLHNPQEYDVDQSVKDFVEESMRISPRVRNFLNWISTRAETPIWIVGSTVSLQALDRFFDSRLFRVVRGAYVPALAIPLAFLGLRSYYVRYSESRAPEPIVIEAPADALTSEERQRLIDAAIANGLLPEGFTIPDELPTVEAPVLIGPPRDESLVVEPAPQEPLGQNPALDNSQAESRPSRSAEPRPIRRRSP